MVLEPGGCVAARSSELTEMGENSNRTRTVSLLFSSSEEIDWGERGVGVGAPTSGWDVLGPGGWDVLGPGGWGVLGPVGCVDERSSELTEAGDKLRYTGGVVRSSEFTEVGDTFER